MKGRDRAEKFEMMLFPVSCFRVSTRCFPPELTSHSSDPRSEISELIQFLVEYLLLLHKMAASGSKRRRSGGPIRGRVARYGRRDEDEEETNVGNVSTNGANGDDEGEDEDSADDLETKVKGNQILPIAELPPDFDGEAEDGATFLALAK